MKTTLRLFFALMTLTTAGTIAVNAQSTTGNVFDTTKIINYRMRLRHNPDMFNRPDSMMIMNIGKGRTVAMERGMGPGQNMGGTMCPCMMRGGMRPGMHMRGMQGNMQAPLHQGAAPQAGMGMRQHFPHYGMLNVPNLTDKQKKDMQELMTKQQEEMQKNRDEMQKKMDSMREAHKKAMLNILSAEQKKWLEENFPGWDKK